MLFEIEFLPYAAIFDHYFLIFEFLKSIFNLKKFLELYFTVSFASDKSIKGSL